MKITEQTTELTEEELIILDLVAKGLTNTEISKQLYISVSKVKLSLGIIMRKLKVDSRVGAVVRGIQQNLVIL